MNRDVWEHYADLLTQRLQRAVYTTEDSIRYTFFGSVLLCGAATADSIVLEYPHPHIPHAEVDTYILPSPSKPGEVLEFKYHRQIPSGRNAPRPQKAGALFKDLGRLQQFPASGLVVHRTLVYVTDTEMHQYLDNPSNGLRDFFQLHEGARLHITDAYLATKSATFQQSVGDRLDLTVEAVLCRPLPRHHALRIYQLC